MTSGATAPDCPNIALLPAQSQQFPVRINFDQNSASLKEYSPDNSLPMASANLALKWSTSVLASLESFSMTPWSVMTAKFSLSLYESRLFEYEIYLEGQSWKTLEIVRDEHDINEC